ncbi:uncharacterized protein N7459_001107 [Penicillium hispanicum]|uniref:uncharacterized protein n=1 Tax=Penicillium hispanicum TaxID=1080232 RepID=UPI0025414F23|nr:uncharacterized protein N7459_001107 [Penicillium hispanicum]KAJ5594899.1 hypothetical protein N7459_001107 [Penicillium hispanicum]
MQMEPWRKRGFVPDSDEDDDVDTPNSAKTDVNNTNETDDYVDLEYIPIPASILNSEPNDSAEEKHEQVEEVTDPKTSGAQDVLRGSVELISSPVAEEVRSIKRTTQPKHTANAAESQSPSTSFDEETPWPRRGLKTYGKRSSATKKTKTDANDFHDTPTKQDDRIWEIPSSPAVQDRPARRTRPRESITRSSKSLQTSSPSVKRCTKASSPEQLNNLRSSRSSSPDELDVVTQFPPKSPQRHADEGQVKASAQQETSDDSPLSSPPLSLQSPPHSPAEVANTATIAPQTNALSQFLPNTEIPEEFMEELSRPVRRSFRERNAIQLHPYALEMAKYQKQMRDGGVRPIRMAMETQKQDTSGATDESQEQDAFNPDTLRSSPPAEEFLPPVRHARQRDGEAALQENRQLNPRSPIRRTLSHKRRKRSYSGTWKDGHRDSDPRSRPEVVIRLGTHPYNGGGASVNDIPSSPPHSRSASSATPTPRVSEGFRFPPGFTPPPTTATGENSKTASPRVNDPNVEESSSSDAGSEDEAGSVSSQSSSGRLQDTAKEREIQRMQRQTRGVLPASWVRLNEQQQLEQQKVAQIKRNAASNRTDGKGVAKRIVRKAGQLRGSTPTQQRPLVDLGDSDESDEVDENTNLQNVERDAADDRLAQIVGFDNPFDQDGDIMEDNRIDYMLPTIPRGRSGLHSQRESLKRPKLKESTASKERHAKKARLKRQTRITDASYGARRTKQSSVRSRTIPRLSILDAPDVNSRPHKEQPQFLRIATRLARSRRDAGRQSPTRKFLQLGSKDDTTDANQSLRDWRRGAIRQTKIAQPQSKPRTSQSLANLTHRTSSTAQESRVPSRSPVHEPNVNPDDQSIEELITIRSDVIPRAPTVPANYNAEAARSTQAEKRGNQWIVRRNVAISSLQRNNTRPAATSLAGPGENQLASQAAFRRSLNLLNRDFRQKHNYRGSKPSLTLDRYIAENVSSNDPADVSSTTSSTFQPGFAVDNASAPHPQQIGRRMKKNKPKRINIESDDFVQDSEQAVLVSDDPDAVSTTDSVAIRPTSFIVGGLFNWQRSYSLDLGVTPFPEGTFFHESTFIGSGEFSRSLNVLKRDLDHDAGSFSIPIKDRTARWGAWNEAVSSEMGSVFEMMTDGVESSVISSSELNSASKLASAWSTYRSVIRYVTETLTFIDPVDRTSFVNRAIGLAFKLRDSMANFITGKQYNKHGLVKLASYNLVFANQIRQIASHTLVDCIIAEDCLNLIKISAKDTVELILGEAGTTELRRLFEDNKKYERREMGLREDFPSAESYIVAKQLLHSSEVFKGVLKDSQLEVCIERIIRNQMDVRNLERVWSSMSTLLPLNEVDYYGIARRESRFKSVDDNWALVQRLLSPALDNYDTNSATQPISYNAYCRALFQRCHRLINVWGWRDCKPVLDALYDFFAHKTLYNLKLEESRGSPSFLDELDKNPSLDVRPGEPCFHTLLKIIASGLRFLALRYDKKKLRNFAWRLLPNHGRVYPKENPLRHEDLDALRNHHDLLCTLYWVVPHGFRPRLETIRNLVNPATSHRETCSINIRSWIRLVRFKLSTDEDVAELEPFANWHSYFLTELRQQHSIARKEIENQGKADAWASQQLIESTITQNQRQIESLLSMALGGLQTAVELAPSLEHAHQLISKTPFEHIFGLFNPKLARINVVVAEALQVIVAYTRKDPTASTLAANDAVSAAAPSTEDDSQEFEGFDDWNELDAMLVQQDPLSEGIEHVQKVLHPIVSRFVSNCFGEDHCPEDAILMNIVDCWTSIAQILARHGLRRWDNYLSPFGDESWTRLRETLQTRKFAPQFLALCVEKDKQVLFDCRIQAMSMWMSSLVERASMLKFQHRLTMALLNGSSRDPLLQNLPFTKDKNDRYKITLEELNQRRLSLISSLLSNMREHVLQMEISGSRNLSVTKQEYSELLQRLMNSMKDNYRELGNGAVEAAQGAYVDFVHRVIRFLQELTSDIRPVDPFFTDPALFPLPSTDPRYIVAKLKRYEPKLSSNKEMQTLMMFIQSIVERAIVERQQSPLVDQLHTAMKDTFEAGRADRPTLRAALLQCVFPAYLELAFSTPAAWILSRPVIQSITLAFKDLLLKLDTTNRACVSSLLRIFNAVFYSSHRALRSLSNRPVRLQDPTVLVFLVDFINMISSSLVVVDYIDRVTESADEPISLIQWFRDFAVAVASNLSAPDADTVSNASIAAISPPEQSPDNSESGTPQHFATARRLAFEDHQSYLRNWSFHDGKYYYTRSGHDAKEVTLEPQVSSIIENGARAKKAFQDATAQLTGSIQNLQWFSA